MKRENICRLLGVCTIFIFIVGERGARAIDALVSPPSTDILLAQRLFATMQCLHFTRACVFLNGARDFGWYIV